MKLLMYYSEVDLEKSFAYVDLVKEQEILLKMPIDERIKMITKKY